MRPPHSALALSLITFLALPLFTQATTVTPTEHHGTWANKDQDGDGVHDELDDYPFNKDKRHFSVVIEKEFNNNVAQATLVNEFPFSVEGTISDSIDIDDFKFNISQELIEKNFSISIVLFKDEPKFNPRMAIITDNGNVLQTQSIAIKHSGRIGDAIMFRPTIAGNYNLSISDKNGNNDSSFTYNALAFVDNDRDGVDDIKEKALGMDSTRQDADNDQILDGNEYHVFKSRTERDLDVDNDNIPNWLDDDSDGDTISDLIETARNSDGDRYPDFVDFDSDGNGILDSNDFDNAIGFMQDTDSDGIPDYTDMDDDGDLLLDTLDSSPKEPLITSENSLLNGVVYHIYGNSYAMNKMMPKGAITISGKNLSGSLMYIVLNKLNDDGKPVNIRVSAKNNDTIEVVVPDYASTNLGGEEVSLFMIIDGKKTNTIKVWLMDKKTPILYDISPKSAKPGELISINGDKLFQGTQATLGNSSIQLEVLGPNNAQFTLPEDSTSGNLALSNQYGTSETIWLNVTRTIPVTVSIPEQYNALNGPFKLSFSDKTYTNLNDISGIMYQIQQTGPDTIIISNAKNTRVLSTIIYPNDEKVLFNLESTIQAIALTGFIQDKPSEEVKRILDLLPKINSYNKLIDYIKKGIDKDIEGTMSVTNMQVAVLIYDIQQEINSQLSVKPKLLSKDHQIQPSSSNDEQRPAITPTESQDGIKVEPTRGGLSDLFDYDGRQLVSESGQKRYHDIK
ncbi:MSCRAMM family adhesin SdrC [Shewanella septentrionalis]|uniref:MSCRAMM family adhesin SdrC n=1 Tax=Shewanella septentrionalis TaxID=2952223 RepID=A0A9X3AXX7_9GAMM|nr:MSCRAMM family adhesin SdrC [Shewanella septentrionalis]MCT7944674.1 MSCRAMM family adhesin SdrC [Shewanella septentrionalis]